MSDINADESLDYKPLLIQWYREDGYVEEKLIDGTTLDSCKHIAVSESLSSDIKVEIYQRDDMETSGNTKPIPLWSK